MATEEKILERVQQLIALAEHLNTPVHEAELALTQANKLIAKHAIDEALLRMSQTSEQRRAPEKRTISLALGTTSWVRAALRTILDKIAKTNRCVAAIAVFNEADVYGAAEDVAWVEMLYTSVYFQLMSKINPKWDESKSYDENVYNFKVAGFKWSEINEMSIRHGGPDARKWEERTVTRFMVDGFLAVSSYWYEEAAAGRAILRDHESNERIAYVSTPTDKIKGSMITAYRRHARKIGDTHPVATQSHEVYKMSFVEGFKGELMARLQRWYDENNTAADTIPGAALALSSMAEDVRNMMYSDHPHLDPEEQRRMREKLRQERAEMLAAMSEKARAEFLEKEERAARRSAKSVRYYDIDSSAHGRGSKVAKEIDLTRKAGYTNAGQNRKEIG